MSLMVLKKILLVMKASDIWEPPEAVEIFQPHDPYIVEWCPLWSSDDFSIKYLGRSYKGIAGQQ